MLAQSLARIRLCIMLHRMSETQPTFPVLLRAPCCIHQRYSAAQAMQSQPVSVKERQGSQSLRRVMSILVRVP